MKRLAVGMVVTGLAALAPESFADPGAAPGQEDFMALCSPCHGADGTGQGPIAASLKVEPADLTHIPARHDGAFPDDMIFETIAGLDMPNAHGTREMPIWGDVFVSEAVGDSVSLKDALAASDEAAARIANLVSYIKSIQKEP